MGPCGFVLLTLTNLVQDSTPGIDYDHALDPGQVRILKLLPGTAEEPLCCEIFTSRLSENPYYEALSYCWGYQWDQELYYAPNRERYYGPFEELKKRGRITRNLGDALRALRLENAARYLWVDAVCINQSDHDEKAWQVRMMDKIYKSATEVHVWLGPADDTSRFGIMAIRYFTDPATTPTAAPWYSTNSDLYASGLSSLLERPWFSRIWTIQEAALAQKVTLICGRDQVSWSTDSISLRRLKFKIKFAATSPQWERSPLHIVNLGPLLEVVETQLREVEDMTGIRLENNLLDVVYEFRHRKSTDPRDKIYAMFNLAEGRRVQLDRIGEYSESREEAWERLARAVRSLDPAAEVQMGI